MVSQVKDFKMAVTWSLRTISDTNLALAFPSVEISERHTEGITEINPGGYL